MSGSSAINASIKEGVPTKKLMLGFPYYGYVWKLVNPNNHCPMTPANGKDGSVVIDKEFLASVTSMTLSIKRVQVLWTTWIGYDDTQSISTKVAYAKNTAYG
ncbi:Class V chitinase, partial [Bienertia sinuspersici]